MSDQGTKGIFRRRWVQVVGVLAIVVVALLALAPMIAGWFAPGVAGGAIGGAINGTAKVGAVSLSWFGGQRIGPVVVNDAQGRQVANVTVDVSRGLLGLAMGGGSDLGRVTVSGSASVTRNADGTLNVATLAKSSPAAPGGGAPAGGPAPSGGGGSIPKGLRAEVVLDKLALEYIDESKTATVHRVAVPALSGTASIAGGKANVDVTAGLEYQRGSGDAPAPGGTLAVKAMADGFADAAGNLTPAKAMLDADVEVKDLAVAVADALAGLDNKLVAGIGEKFQASIKAKGTVSDADVTIAASSRAVNVDVGLKTAAGVLTSSRPGVVSVQGGGLMPLIPGLEAGLAKGGMTLERLPDFKATIDNLRLPLPPAGKAPDFRGGSLAIGIETTQATGTVRVPQADGKPGPAQTMTIAPLKASLVSADLGAKTTLTAAGSAMVGGKTAGVLAVDLSASGALNEAGIPRMPGKIEGSAKLSGVATALAQPLVESMGVQLAQDVGPELTVVLTAAPAEGAAPAAGTLAPTALTFEVQSANINGSARARVDGNTVRMPGDAAQFKVGSAGPLVGRILGKSGVAMESGLPLTLMLSDVVADLDKLKGAKPDLRGVGGRVRIETGAAAGKLALAGQPVRSFELAPFLATLDGRELAKGATLKASGAAKVDGQNAGMLDVDLAATGLVSADGSPIKGLPAIQGEATIDEVSTAIAQPLVEAMGLDLPAGVGPKLAVMLKAAGKGGEASAGAIPATDLDLSIKSAGVNGSVALTLDGRTVRKRAGDAVFSLRSPGTLAGKAARNAGVAISDGGYAKATLKDFAVEFDEKWSPRLDRSAAEAEINVGGFSVTTVPKPAQPGAAAAPSPEPVSLGQFIVAAKLAPGAAPTASLRGSGKHQGADFFMQGDLQLAGLIGKDGAITPAAMRPLGTIDLNNVPTSLASLGIPAPAAAKPGEKPGPDLAKLIRDAVGPTATIKLAAVQPEGGPPDARAVSMTLAAARFNGAASGLISDTSRALTKLDFRGQVSPELAGTLIDTLGAGLESKPKLLSPATLTISATPFAVAVNKDGSMDLAKAADATIKVGLEGKALVNNVVVKGEDGKPRDLGTVGLENVLLTANVPLGSLAPGSAAKPAQVSLTAGVLGAADKRIVDLKAGAKVDLAGGAPQGDLNADLSLNVLDCAWVDTFLGKPGLLAEGAGPSATVDLAAVVQFPKGGPPPAGSEAPKFDRAMLTAAIKAANLSTTQPLKATMLPDRVSIDKPMVLAWTMPAAWGNAYVLAPTKPGEAPIARFIAPTQVTVSLFKLAMATGAQPLKPGIFLADVQVDSAGTVLEVGSGKEIVQSPVKTFSTRITGGKDPGVLGFSLTMADAGGGEAPGGKPAVSFAGGVYGIADAAGKPTPDAAKITANGTAVGVSTAMVDALAHQGGLLTEALGPRVNLDLKAEGLSKTGGNLAVVAASPRAEARLTGSVNDGTFRIASPDGKPAQIAKLNEASPKLGSMLVKGLPLIGSFEKRPEDGPATVNATGMVVPIDGDMRKLNGQLLVDLGAAHFATSDAFSALLKVVKQKNSGTVGQRIEPFQIDFKDGVGTYQKFTVPVGEFRIATTGTIDLVNKQMDVVTYVPFGALADEAAGKFSTGLGGKLAGVVPGIESATMMPIRTKGSFDKPQTQPDLELFLKGFRPDQLFKNIFKK